jgi:hypothetical protein
MKNNNNKYNNKNEDINNEKQGEIVWEEKK